MATRKSHAGAVSGVISDKMVGVTSNEAQVKQRSNSGNQIDQSGQIPIAGKSRKRQTGKFVSGVSVEQDPRGAFVVITKIQSQECTSKPVNEEPSAAKKHRGNESKTAKNATKSVVLATLTDVDRKQTVNEDNKLVKSSNSFQSKTANKKITHVAKIVRRKKTTETDSESVTTASFTDFAEQLLVEKQIETAKTSLNMRRVASDRISRNAVAGKHPAKRDSVLASVATFSLLDVNKALPSDVKTEVFVGKSSAGLNERVSSTAERGQRKRKSTETYAESASDTTVPYVDEELPVIRHHEEVEITVCVNDKETSKCVKRKKAEAVNKKSTKAVVGNQVSKKETVAATLLPYIEDELVAVEDVEVVKSSSSVNDESEARKSRNAATPKQVSKSEIDTESVVAAILPDVVSALPAVVDEITVSLKCYAANKKSKRSPAVVSKSQAKVESDVVSVVPVIDDELLAVDDKLMKGSLSSKVGAVNKKSRRAAAGKKVAKSETNTDADVASSVPVIHEELPVIDKVVEDSVSMNGNTAHKKSRRAAAGKAGAKSVIHADSDVAPSMPALDEELPVVDDMEVNKNPAVDEVVDDSVGLKGNTANKKSRRAAAGKKIATSETNADSAIASSVPVIDEKLPAVDEVVEDSVSLKGNTANKKFRRGAAGKKVATSEANTDSAIASSVPVIDETLPAVDEVVEDTLRLKGNTASRKSRRTVAGGKGAKSNMHADSDVAPIVPVVDVELPVVDGMEVNNNPAVDEGSVSGIATAVRKTSRGAASGKKVAKSETNTDSNVASSVPAIDEKLPAVDEVVHDSVNLKGNTANKKSRSSGAGKKGAKFETNTDSGVASSVPVIDEELPAVDDIEVNKSPAVDDAVVGDSVSLIAASVNKNSGRAAAGEKVANYEIKTDSESDVASSVPVIDEEVPVIDEIVEDSVSVKGNAANKKSRRPKAGEKGEKSELCADSEVAPSVPVIDEELPVVYDMDVNKSPAFDDKVVESSVSGITAAVNKKSRRTAAGKKVARAETNADSDVASSVPVFDEEELPVIDVVEVARHSSSVNCETENEKQSDVSEGNQVSQSETDTESLVTSTVRDVEVQIQIERVKKNLMRMQSKETNDSNRYPAKSIKENRKKSDSEADALACVPEAEKENPVEDQLKDVISSVSMKSDTLKKRSKNAILNKVSKIKIDVAATLPGIDEIEVKKVARMTRNVAKKQKSSSRAGQRIMKTGDVFFSENGSEGEDKSLDKTNPTIESGPDLALDGWDDQSPKHSLPSMKSSISSNTETGKELNNVSEKSDLWQKTSTGVKHRSETEVDPTCSESGQKFVGAHVSMAGGLWKAIKETQEMGGKAIGMFLKSQRSWKSKPLESADAELFKETLAKSGISPWMIVPHGSYLMNCGSPDEVVLRKSRDNLIDELQRCEQLGLPIYNFHPGSTKGTSTLSECIERIAESINLAHSNTKTVMTVIENMSGQGNTIGGSFSELRAIIDLVVDKSRMGVCLDTCHAFAAGYDLKSEEGYKEMKMEFDRVIGRQYLRAVHLNDSKDKLGCHLDRHENIGKGMLGRETFKRIMNDPFFDDVPMVLETPECDYSREIKYLYQLQKTKQFL